MSRTIGAEGLGLYNMIHPLFSIAFAVCAGSIQTALSQYIAANQEKGPAVFKCGLFLSLSLSVIPLLLLWKGKMFLAGQGIQFWRRGGRNAFQLLIDSIDCAAHSKAETGSFGNGKRHKIVPFLCALYDLQVLLFQFFHHRMNFAGSFL